VPNSRRIESRDNRCGFGNTEITGVEYDREVTVVDAGFPVCGVGPGVDLKPEILKLILRDECGIERQPLRTPVVVVPLYSGDIDRGRVRRQTEPGPVWSAIRNLVPVQPVVFGTDRIIYIPDHGKQFRRDRTCERLVGVHRYCSVARRRHAPYMGPSQRILYARFIDIPVEVRFRVVFGIVHRSVGEVGKVQLPHPGPVDVDFRSSIGTWNR